MADQPNCKDLFTAFGTLRVNIIEAIDVISNIATKHRKPAVKKCKFVVGISVVDNHEREIAKYNSSPHLYYTGESVHIGEEYIFDNVSSLNSLLISFHAIGMEVDDKANGSVGNMCIGIATIPLARLEENIQVVQWYQLFGHSSAGSVVTEGLRCAVKVECLFLSDGHGNGNQLGKKKQNSHNSHGPPTANKRQSSASTPYKEDLNVPRGGGDTNISTAVTHTHDSSTAHTPHGKGTGHGASRHRISDINLAAVLGSPTSAGDGQQPNGSSTGTSPLVSPLRKASFHMDNGASALTHRHTARRGSVTSANCRRWFDKVHTGSSGKSSSGASPFKESAFESAQRVRLDKIDDEHNFVVDTGVIDYCLVLGPASPYSLCPSHYVDKCDQIQQLFSPDVRSRHKSNHSGSSSSGDGGLSPPGSTGLFSSSTAPFGASVEELDVLVYDRLPRQDHADVELPGRVEWFACPEGSKTIMSVDRPEPYFTSFVLSAGGDADEHYGLSINFFVDISVVENTATSLGGGSSADMGRLVEDEATRNSLWWHPEMQLDFDESKQQHPSYHHLSNPERPHHKKWTSLSVCVLFRLPFVKQLAQCLRCAYNECILSKLEAWEQERNTVIRNALIDDQADNTPCSPLSTATATRLEDAMRAIPSFPLFIEQIVATLCLECPVPVPGLLAVSLQLPDSRARVNEEASPMLSIQTSFDSSKAESHRSVTFSLPNLNALPQCAYPIECLLKFFGPRTMVDVIACVMSECRLLFHSTDLSKLPMVCEALRTLIYPLKWTHVYLPIVPMHLLNLVEAPVPFMLGTHSKWLKHIHLEYLSDIVLVDCDSGAVDVGMAEPTRFPELEDRWLVSGLREIATPGGQFLDQLDRASHFTKHAEAKVNEGLGAGDISESETKSVDGVDDNSKVTSATADIQIQLLFFDVFFQLLRYVPDCLFYLNPSCPVFNRPLFMNDYTPDEYRDCLEFITVTNSFHELTETIHTTSLSFFFDCITRVTEAERKELETTLQQNLSAASASAAANNASSKSLHSATPPLSRVSSFVSPRPPLTRKASTIRTMNRTMSRQNNRLAIEGPVGFISPGAMTSTKSAKTPQFTPTHFSFIEEDTFGAAAALNGEDSDDDQAPAPPPPQRPQLIPAFSIADNDFSGLTVYVSSPDSTPFDSARASPTSSPSRELVPSFGSAKVAFGNISPLVISSAGTPNSSSKKTPPPRGMMTQKSGRGLMRSMSVLGMQGGGVACLNNNNSNHDLPSTVTPSQQLPNSAAIISRQGDVEEECANEIVYRDFFPEWLLQPSPLATETIRRNSKYKVDSIRGLLHHRLAIYLPYVKARITTTKEGIASTTSIEKVLTLRTEYTAVAIEMVLSAAKATAEVGRESSFNARPGRPSGIAIDIPATPNSESMRLRKITNRTPSFMTQKTTNNSKGDLKLIQPHESGQTSRPSHRMTRQIGRKEQSFNLSDLEEDLHVVDDEADLFNASPNCPTAKGVESPIVDSGDSGPAPMPQSAPSLVKTHNAALLRVAAAATSVSIRTFDSGMSESENESDSDNSSTAGSDASGRDEDEDDDADVSPGVLQPGTIAKFDDKSIHAAQRNVFIWTLYDIADQLHMERSALLKQFQALALEAAGAAAGMAAQGGSKMNHRSIISQAKSESTVNKINTAYNKLRCDDSITEFLQQVVTQSEINEVWMETAIEKSLAALNNDANNRMGLINILKHAKKGDENFESSNSSVYPLNGAAFEGFFKLLNGLLIICSRLQDYLCAYNLLEVGGLYFHIIQDSEARSKRNMSLQSVLSSDNDRSVSEGTTAGEDMIEFLSERISTHPIYQNVSLWRAVLIDRVPVDSVTPDKHKQHGLRRDSVASSVVAPTPTGGDGTPSPNKKGKRFFGANHTNTVISETHSLLYMMLGLGVNSARALHFIQVVAAEYSLGVNEYFKLQRFTTRMWSGMDEGGGGDFDHDHMNDTSDHRQQLEDGSGVTQTNGSGDYDQLQSLVRHGSKGANASNRFDRRASRTTSIADMLAKQGHGGILTEGAGSASFHKQQGTRHLPLGSASRDMHSLQRANSTDYGSLLDIRALSMDEVLGITSTKGAGKGGLVPESTGSHSFSNKRQSTTGLSTSLRIFTGSETPAADTSIYDPRRKHNMEDLNLVVNTHINAGGGDSSDTRRNIVERKSMIMHMGRTNNDSTMSVGPSDVNVRIDSYYGDFRDPADTSEMSMSMYYSATAQQPEVPVTSGGHNRHSSHGGESPIHASQDIENRRRSHSLPETELSASAGVATSESVANKIDLTATLNKFIPGLFNGAIGGAFGLTTSASAPIGRARKDRHSLSSHGGELSTGTGGLSSDRGSSHGEYAPNKFQPFDLQTIDDGHATVLDVIQNYMVVGAEEGHLCVTDLSDGSEVLRMKHSSGSGERYGGITSVACLPSLTDNGYLFFSACSLGITKAWTLPFKTIEQHQMHTSNNVSPAPPSYWGGVAMSLRSKASLAVIKTHSAPVCNLVAATYAPAQSWLLASGDEKGGITLSRGTETSSTTVSAGVDLRAAGVFSGAVLALGANSQGVGSSIRSGSSNTSSTGMKGASVTSMSFLGSVFGLSEPPKTMRYNSSHNVKNAKTPTSASNSNNDELLAVGTSNGLITLVDVHTAKPVYYAEGHRGSVTKVLGLRSNMFLSASLDRTIKLWDIRTKGRGSAGIGAATSGKTLEERSLGSGPDTFNRCAASPVTALAVGGWDNTLVISASADGVIRLWDLRHDVNVPCSILKGHNNRVSALYWNGRDEIYSASHDGTVRSWDSISGRNVNTLRAFEAATETGITSLGVSSFMNVSSIVEGHEQPASTVSESGLSLNTSVAPVRRTCIVTGSWDGTVRGFYHENY